MSPSWDIEMGIMNSGKLVDSLSKILKINSFRETIKIWTKFETFENPEKIFSQREQYIICLEQAIEKTKTSKLTIL